MTYLVLGVSGLALLLMCIFVTKKQQGMFDERFPPISDEEFLARCRPGTNPEVALKVRRIISKQLGVEYERIYPSSRLMEDLGAD